MWTVTKEISGTAEQLWDWEGGGGGGKMRYQNEKVKCLEMIEIF